MHDDEVGTASLRAAHDEARVLHSDPHDFAGLYIRHRASFTLHARHYLRDERDADEVVQEAFLRLFLALPELETELQALAYCRRTITNLCIDRYRAQARRPHLVDIASVPLDELADEEPLDPVVRAEDAALVRSALSMLSPLHRAALVKREIEEKPLPVIAEELEVPEESVKHLLFRARRALRRLLVGTSLAPGGEGDGEHSLVAGLRAGSGGLAALLVMLVLALGSGPDLEAIPVVGVDLPDLIGAGRVAEAVGAAVNDIVEGVTPGPGPSSPGGEPADPAGPGGAPAPRGAVDASPSPSASASTAPAVPGASAPGASAPVVDTDPGTSTGTSPRTGPPASDPFPAPDPVLPPSDSAEPSPDPTTPPTTEPTPPPSPEPLPTPDVPGELAPTPEPTALEPEAPSAEPLPVQTGLSEPVPAPGLLEGASPVPDESPPPLP